MTWLVEPRFTSTCGSWQKPWCLLHIASSLSDYCRVWAVQVFSESCPPSQTTTQPTSCIYTQDGAVFKSSRKQFDSSSMTLWKVSSFTKHIYTVCMHVQVCLEGQGWLRAVILKEPLQEQSPSWVMEAYLDRILRQSHGPNAYLRRRNLLNKGQNMRCVEANYQEWRILPSSEYYIMPLYRP